MRFYELLNFQHVMGYIFGGLIFMVFFGVGLAYSHLNTADAEKRKTEVIYRYPEGIEDRNAPYPLIITLILLGVFIWGVFYILLHGLLNVKI